MISYQDVLDAQKRISPYVLRTPLLRVPALDPILGCEVYIKSEALQFTGSFKLRGATNCMLSLSDEQRRNGVVCGSSGNHAQGVACAAQRLGVSAVIVMPLGSNPVKIEGVKSFGGTVELYGERPSDKEVRVAELVKEGRCEIHPYDNDYVRAGQGTIGLEILEDQPEIDAVVVPVGGGGLISGIATAVKAIRPQAKMIGVEPEGAPRYTESYRQGKLVWLEKTDTIADGTRTDHANANSFELIRQRVDSLATVSDDAIRQAMKLIVSKAKIVAEPSSSMGIGAVLQGKLHFDASQKVCFVISGGNNDLNLLADVIRG